MAKKKTTATNAPAETPNQSTNNVQNSSKPSSSTQDVPAATPEVTEAVNGVANLSLTDKERGEIDRQTKSREEIMAERKAKKAAKGNKGVNAPANVAQPPPRQQAQQNRTAPNCQSTVDQPTATAQAAPVERPAPRQQPQQNKKQARQNSTTSNAQTAVNQPAVATQESTTERPQPEPRSAIRREGPRVNREVQFDLNTTVLRTPSEETLSVDMSGIAAFTEPLLNLHVHPAFLTLAAKCERGEILNIDDLCEEFLVSFNKFIEDWGQERLHNPEADPTSLGVDLDLAIRPQLGYLTEDGRWPLPYALGNIVRQLKKEIKRLKEPCKHAHTKEDGTVAAELPGGCDKLQELQEWLEDTRELYFVLSTDAIAAHLLKKKTFSKKILTFDWCRVVNRILLKACDSPEHDLQHVVVLDQEVNGRGIRHIESLIEHDEQKKIKLDYGDLYGLSVAIEQCSMVLIGCSAVLSNGCVAAPKGALSIALAAQINNVPFMVCAQTFKFVDKVQSYGRMALLGRENMELVPASLVTAIVTDIRIVPPSSAPAILKAKALENQDQII